MKAFENLSSVAALYLCSDNLEDGGAERVERVRGWVEKWVKEMRWERQFINLNTDPNPIQEFSVLKIRSQKVEPRNEID